MLDLTRLDVEEPYDLDDYMVFQSLDTDKLPFKQAWAEYCKHMVYDKKMKVNSSSLSLGTTDWYLADFYVVAQSDAYQEPDLSITDLTYRWRYTRRDFQFKLTRYSFKDVDPKPQDPRNLAMSKRNHWLHYVVTNRPSEFKGIQCTER